MEMTKDEKKEEKGQMPEENQKPEVKTEQKPKKKDKKSQTGAQIEDLKRQKEEAHDKHLRVMAEFDNFRKRTSREKSEMYNDGVTAAVLRFLPAIDSFERAMTAISPEVLEGDGTLKGLAMILRQMKDILTALGVEEIEAVGRTFDPNLHAAVMMVQSEEYESGIVAEELMKGYIYKDRPIRHSMVKVAE